MKKILMIIISLFLCLAIACKKDDSEIENKLENSKTINNNFEGVNTKRLNSINTKLVTIYPKKTYLDNIYKFTDDFTNLLVDNANNNFVYSPFNIYVYLSAIREATSGQTKEELSNVLGTEEELKTYLQYLISDINYSQDSTLMKMSNGFWFNNKYEVVDDFLNIMQNYYYTEVFSTDFSDSSKEFMANWLNNNTNNMFKVTSNNYSYLNSSSQIAYICSLYVKASWINTFNEHNNYIDIFKDYDNNEYETAFMKKTEKTFYKETSDYEKVKISLTKGSVEFVLPKNDLKVNQLFKDDNLYDILNNKYDDTDEAIVNFAMPKLDYQYSLSLNDYLEILGVHSIFSEENELNFINGTNYKFSDLIEANGIIFNEEGVEAASYVEETVAAMPPSEITEVRIVDFILNKPFIFIIRSNYNVPLYVGMIVKM